MRHKSAHLRSNYTQHTQALLPSFLPSDRDTPQAQRSVARTVCLQSAHVRAQPFLKNSEERARLGRFCPLLPRRPTLRRLDDDTSLLFSSQESEGLFLIAGINIPVYRPHYDGVLGWSGTWILVLFWSLCFYRFLSFPFVPSSFLFLSGVVASTADVMICWEARASMRMWLVLRFRSMVLVFVCCFAIAYFVAGLVLALCDTHTA